MTCLQAAAEHSVVLRPNHNSEKVGIGLLVSIPKSPNDATVIVVDTSNPRLLMLFRWGCLLSTRT